MTSSSMCSPWRLRRILNWLRMCQWCIIEFTHVFLVTWLRIITKRKKKLGWLLINQSIIITFNLTIRIRALSHYIWHRISHFVVVFSFHSSLLTHACTQRTLTFAHSLSLPHPFTHLPKLNRNPSYFPSPLFFNQIPHTSSFLSFFLSLF